MNWLCAFHLIKIKILNMQVRLVYSRPCFQLPIARRQPKNVFLLGVGDRYFFVISSKVSWYAWYGKIEIGFDPLKCFLYDFYHDFLIWLKSWHITLVNRLKNTQKCPKCCRKPWFFELFQTKPNYFWKLIQKWIDCVPFI